MNDGLINDRETSPENKTGSGKPVWYSGGWENDEGEKRNRWISHSKNEEEGEREAADQEVRRASNI